MIKNSTIIVKSSKRLAKIKMEKQKLKGIKCKEKARSKGDKHRLKSANKAIRRKSQK